MPRRMPAFDRVLQNHADSAIAIVRAGELAHAAGSLAIRKEWAATKLEALYELAFLRVFAAWEMCLESVFFRSLCGYASAVGQETLVAGSYFRNLAAAEASILTPRRPFLLWHDPEQ